MDEFMKMAIAEAQQGLAEGGIPIGSVLVKDGQLVARGHNKRVQENNPILHGEMDCLNNAGRIGSYRQTVIYSTLMPCYMCAGTIVQFKIPKVIVGESQTFSGARAFLESHGVNWRRPSRRSYFICRIGLSSYSVGDELVSERSFKRSY